MHKNMPNDWKKCLSTLDKRVKSFFLNQRFVLTGVKSFGTESGPISNALENMLEQSKALLDTYKG